MKKYIPIILIAAGMVALYFSGFHKALDFETLRYHHYEMKEYIQTNPVLAPFIFMGAYAAVALFSIPGGLILSLIGGYLFMQPLCTLYVVIGATTGATLLFLAAKTALGDFLQRRIRPRLKKMEKGFNKNAANYLLFLRLLPLFPFWLVNLAPAFFNVRLRTFIWTTFVGIIPGTFVLTQAGRGINSLFETAEEFSIRAFFNSQVIIALVCLAIIALLPIVVKKWREKKHDRQ